MLDNNIITMLGLTILLVYGITQILTFYGININTYGSYLVFYLFILITSFILPRYYNRSI